MSPNRARTKEPPPPFSVDRLLEETRNEKTRPCFICGKQTHDEFYGYSCCDPYDSAGNIVSQCKWTLRDRTDPWRRPMPEVKSNPHGPTGGFGPEGGVDA